MKKLLCKLFGHKYASDLMYGYGVEITTKDGMPWKCLRCLHVCEHYKGDMEKTYHTGGYMHIDAENKTVEISVDEDGKYAPFNVEIKDK